MSSGEGARGVSAYLNNPKEKYRAAVEGTAGAITDGLSEHSTGVKGQDKDGVPYIDKDGKQKLHHGSMLEYVFAWLTRGGSVSYPVSTVNELNTGMAAPTTGSGPIG
jgi:hypothetical protein